MANAKILGTHNPTNIASCFSPEKKRVSEYTRERMAATKNNLSDVVAFLNIFFENKSTTMKSKKNDLILLIHKKIMNRSYISIGIMTNYAVLSTNVFIAS